MTEAEVRDALGQAVASVEPRDALEDILDRTRPGRIRSCLPPVLVVFISATLLVFCAFLAAGCSSASSSSAPAHPASHAAAPAPVSTIGYGDAGRVCAALNALEFAGDSRQQAAATVEQPGRVTVLGTARVTAADVARARQLRCPDL